MTWSPGRSAASRANTAAPRVESRWPRTTAGPVSPGTGPSLYHPAWLGSDGTWMVPSDARPRSVTLASTPIAGMRMRAGGELRPRFATAGNPVPPPTGIGVVTGMMDGVARGAGAGMCIRPLVAAPGALEAAPVVTGAQPTRADSARGATHNVWPSRTPALLGSRPPSTDSQGAQTKEEEQHRRQQGHSDSDADAA